MARKRAESRARYYIREQAAKRGWNTRHPDNGGDCLEEQEIVAAMPGIGLGSGRPDFLLVLCGLPAVVIEAKNAPGKIDQAISGAIKYAETINSSGKYDVKIAVGAAGEEDHGFIVEVRYLKNGKWEPLLSNDCEITTIPSRKEVNTALLADNASTDVEAPSIAEFIDSAIKLSKILRTAKVEAPLRPKVIGALTLAMYQGDIEVYSDNPLDHINELIDAAIEESADLKDDKKKKLVDILHLRGQDYGRLSPHIAKIVHLLRGLNIRAALHTDTDFLGLFYEAFLRYGYDNNALGIVFTPRHITKVCVELANVKSTDNVIDIACGTGGFLVSAFDKMMATAKSPEEIEKIKISLYGHDTNPTIWALATLNMFFRGDGKTHIENRNCLEADSINATRHGFTKSFLNPPFSQEGEPERLFINASMTALEPGGIFTAVIKAGIFADDEHKNWRGEFTRNHTILGLVSLPEELFYPAAAPTSILIAKAHIPHPREGQIFIARIANDGFKKLKGKRVETEGSQLPGTVNAFHRMLQGQVIQEANAISIEAGALLDGNEWSPQQWLYQPIKTQEELHAYENDIRLSIYRAISSIPELGSSVLDDFTAGWASLPGLEYGVTRPVCQFFDVANGKSKGEKNYREGAYPYISSGDATNSIIRLIDKEEGEVFADGAITVTAFGQAYIQPWAFMARGNGGSSVRVLVPKFKMNFNELVWFASQVNAQKWRFFYARMAIKSRLEKLEITSPPEFIPGPATTISERIKKFKEVLVALSSGN